MSNINEVDFGLEYTADDEDFEEVEVYNSTCIHRHISQLEIVKGDLGYHYEILMTEGIIADDAIDRRSPASIRGITSILASKIDYFQSRYGVMCWINLNEHPEEDNGYPIYVIEFFNVIRETMDLIATYKSEKLDFEHKNLVRE